ncbi:MAG: hypothetical protein M3R27_05800 [Bacteroidota bacterium]|nr:hypothetical protein [Bacteroidota bacterium]
MALTTTGLVIGGDWTIYTGQWAGYYEPFIAKVDFQGVIVFTYKFDNNSNSGKVTNVIALQDGGFYVGCESIDNFQDSNTDTTITTPAASHSILKYSASGLIEWFRFLPEALNTWAMTCDANENIYFGSAWTTNDFSIFKYDTTGIFQNKKIIFNGAGTLSRVEQIDFDPSDNLYIAGYFYDSLTIGNNKLLTKGYGIGNWVLAKQDVSNQNEWYFLPDGGQSGGMFSLNDNCELSVGMSFSDSLSFGNYHFYFSNISVIGKLNCESVVSIGESNQLLANNFNIYPNLEVNNRFAGMLEGFKIDDQYIPLLKEQLFLTFQEHNASLKDNEEMIKRQLTDIRQKLDRLEERFIVEELTADLYHKYKSKFEKEMEEIEEQKANNKIEMSKLEDYITVSLEFACNLREMWALGDYAQRQELQNALFEGGIVYDRKKDECRSTGNNEFITEIARISGNFGIFPTANKKNLMLTSVGAVRAESRTTNGYGF